MHFLALAAVLSAMPCWTMYDRALAHSAAAPHPPYVSYSERTSMIVDGEPFLNIDAHIDYRDDGIARVADERFDYSPIVTRTLEPGPPELGPYGLRRDMWEPPPPGVRTIAAVHAHGSVTCTVEGVSNVQSRQVYHLVFTGANPERPHLDELWLDTQTLDIWKLAVTAPAPVVDDASASPGLARYDVDLSYQGPYLVVHSVAWSYRMRTHSQQAHYSGNYTFGDYSFPRELPPSYFALAE